MRLSASSEPVLAVLNTVAALSTAASVAGTSDPAVVPPVVTGGLSVTTVFALALGWFLRRYTTAPGAHSIKADAARAKAEIALIRAEDPAAAAARIVRDAQAVAQALHPMEG